MAGQDLTAAAHRPTRLANKAVSDKQVAAGGVRLDFGASAARRLRRPDLEHSQQDQNPCVGWPENYSF
jgi:hypothetical protein